jgi:hypothetical protein
MFRFSCWSETHLEMNGSSDPEITKFPVVSDQSAKLGRAYHEWERHERNLARLKELAAPDLIIDGNVRLRDKSLAVLRSLGWASGPVRIHHTPYDLDRARSPTAARALQRALVLAAMSERAMLEAEGELKAIPALQEWARCLDDEFEPDERATLMSAGSLSQRQKLESSWLIEGASALVWALGLGDPLPFDSMCKPSLVRKQLGFLVPERLKTGVEPMLRPHAELVVEFERLWTVHWRLTDYRIRPGIKEFEKLGGRSPFWFGPLAIDGIPTAMVRNPAQDEPELDIQGMADMTSEEVADMAIRGHAISEAPDDDRNQCESIVLERRRALGWVCGLTALYSDVPIDT